MNVVGYILIAIGAISLFGNFTGGGRGHDPNPTNAGNRVIVWLAVIGIGVYLVWGR